MKILFLTSTLGYGGAAKMLAFAANGFSRKGDFVSVVAYKAKTAAPSFDGNISLCLLGEELGDKGHVSILCRLRKEIQSVRPDVIVSFLSFPNFYAVLLGKLLHIPVIISERGNPYIAATGFKMKLIYAVMNMADGAIFQTDGAKSFFSKRLQKKSAVIPNPVVKRNKEVCYDIHCNNHEIVCIGRLENVQKRIDLLIDAMEIIVKEFPNAKLLIYGDGQDEEMLKRMASSKAYAANIKFIGKTSTPEECMVHSELYVIASDYEGIPNTLIEAMSVGMPVVATDCDPGGARMLITNRVNGIIVEKGNHLAIANAILEIYRDKKLKALISCNAKEICNTYKESRILDMWQSYLEEICFSKYN